MGRPPNCGPSAIPTYPTLPPTIPPIVVVGPAPGSQPSYTLSGVVAEMSPTGLEPVGDVEVYCDSWGSPTGHTFAHTDAQGSYSFSWAADGVHPLLVKKTGYDVIDPARTFPDGTGEKRATVSGGDTRFDILIVRR